MMSFRNLIPLVLCILLHLAIGCTSKDNKNNNYQTIKSTISNSNESIISPQSESPQTDRRQVTEEEINSFVHRYLNDILDSYNDHNDRHCHDGYCYYGIINQDNQDGIKIEENVAKTIVKSLLKQHTDLLDYLAKIRTSPEFLPYLEKYKTLKMKFTSKPLSPGLKIMLVGDEYVPPVDVAHCFFTEGMVQINAHVWDDVIKSDDLFSEFLVFHELAHCDLKRYHEDYRNDDVNFLSFMNEELTMIVAPPSIIEAFNKEIPYSYNTQDNARESEYEGNAPQIDIDRDYIKDHFEQLYIELFSKDKFYNYDESHYEDSHHRYKEVEDLSEFTDVVNNDLISIKKKLQRLVQDQQ